MDKYLDCNVLKVKLVVEPLCLDAQKVSSEPKSYQEIFEIEMNL